MSARSYTPNGAARSAAQSGSHTPSPSASCSSTPHPHAPGAILNVSSVLGLRAGRFQGVYAMTKAAVISMTKTLAVEWGPSGIRVNAIAPGFIDTKFSAALTHNDGIKKMIVDKTPLGRIGSPDDVSGLAVYLASDAAKFVTGATFVADGGLTVE